LDAISNPLVREIRYRKFGKYEIRVLKWHLAIIDIDFAPNFGGLVKVTKPSATHVRFKLVEHGGCIFADRRKFVL
jgi:hypothetical protein